MRLKMADLLDTFGSDLTAERYNVVLAFLAEQEILCPDDFIGLRPFHEMAGVDILDQHEIKILETIAAAVQSKSARKRTSHHHEALCSRCACVRILCRHSLLACVSRFCLKRAQRNLHNRLNI